MNAKYLAYNIIKTDYAKLHAYVLKLSKDTGKSKIDIYKDVLLCLLKYDTRFLDYFYFRFFDKSVDKMAHTNVWDMYNFHKKYNGKNADFLRNKLKFRKRFKEYFSYEYFEFSNKNDIDRLIDWIDKSDSSKLVAKDPYGTVGDGVVILSIERRNGILFLDSGQAEVVLLNLYNSGFSLFERYIEQHEVLKKINPGSINTIRIVSFVDKRRVVKIWGALLRMGVDKGVDNFDAGGISAKIDLETGIIISSAINKDPFDTREFDFHPISNSKITGVKIPFWNEVIALINKAALELEDVRTVGWDIALTIDGPTLIEGNDNWDKTHFELVSRLGLNCLVKQALHENI